MAMRGSFEASVREPVVRRIVMAKRVFLAQGREVSASRRWAWDRIVRKRWRQPRTKSREAEVDVELDELTPWRKRLKTGNACGTTRV